MISMTEAAATIDLVKNLLLNKPISYLSIKSPSVRTKLSSLSLSILYLAIYRKCMECSGKRSQAFILKCPYRGVLVMVCLEKTSNSCTVNATKVTVLLTIRETRCYVQMHHVHVQYATHQG